MKINIKKTKEMRLNSKKINKFIIDKKYWYRSGIHIPE